MKMDLREYDGKKVKVFGTDNKIYIGIVILYTPAKDNEIDEDAIALSSGVWLDESDIKTIELV